METSAAKLQKQVDVLSKQILRLQDNLEHQKYEKEKYKRALKRANEKIELLNNKIIELESIVNSK